MRSYRTISPLPIADESPDQGGIFSVALAVGSHPPGITWHPALWSPDFPPLIFLTRKARFIQQAAIAQLTRFTGYRNIWLKTIDSSYHLLIDRYIV